MARSRILAKVSRGRVLSVCIFAPWPCWSRGIFCAGKYRNSARQIYSQCYIIGLSARERGGDEMDIEDLAAKVLQAVIARLIADGIEAAIRRALHPRERPKHLR